MPSPPVPAEKQNTCFHCSNYRVHRELWKSPWCELFSDKEVWASTEACPEYTTKRKQKRRLF